MRKILSGFGGLLLMVVLVAGVGYALFTSTVEVTGMEVKTASPGLKMNLDGGETWSSAIDFSSDTLFQPLMPGVSDWGEFWLMNDSNGGAATSRPLDMEISAKIMNAGSGWTTTSLKDVVKMRVCLYSDTAVDHCDEDNATPWMTLQEWNAEHRMLPGLIPQGGMVHYAIGVMLDETVGNTYSGQSIDGISIDIVGTQEDPTPEDSPSESETEEPAL